MQRIIMFEQLNDEEFRKEWDASECEYSLANSLVKARKEKVITRKYMFVHILFHFLFVADVISSIILYSSLKRKK